MHEHDERGTLSGFDAVAQALKQEAFPMDMEALYYAIGELPITTEDGDKLSVRDLLDRAGATAYQTPEEAVAALHEVARNAVASTAADASVSLADSAPGLT